MHRAICRQVKFCIFKIKDLKIDFRSGGRFYPYDEYNEFNMNLRGNMITTPSVDEKLKVIMINVEPFNIKRGGRCNQNLAKRVEEKLKMLSVFVIGERSSNKIQKKFEENLVEFLNQKISEIFGNCGDLYQAKRDKLAGSKIVNQIVVSLYLFDLVYFEEGTDHESILCVHSLASSGKKFGNFLEKFIYKKMSDINDEISEPYLKKMLTKKIINTVRGSHYETGISVNESYRRLNKVTQYLNDALVHQISKIVFEDCYVGFRNNENFFKLDYYIMDGYNYNQCSTIEELLQDYLLFEILSLNDDFYKKGLSGGQILSNTKSANKKNSARKFLDQKLDYDKDSSLEIMLKLIEGYVEKLGMSSAKINYLLYEKLKGREDQLLRHANGFSDKEGFAIKLLKNLSYYKTYNLKNIYQDCDIYNTTNNTLFEDFLSGITSPLKNTDPYYNDYLNWERERGKIGLIKSYKNTLESIKDRFYERNCKNTIYGFWERDRPASRIICEKVQI